MEPSIYDPETQTRIPLFSVEVMALLKKGYREDDVLTMQRFNPNVYNRTHFLTNDILYNIILHATIQDAGRLCQLDKQANLLCHHSQLWQQKIVNRGYPLFEFIKSMDNYKKVNKVIQDVDVFIKTHRSIFINKVSDLSRVFSQYSIKIIHDRIGGSLLDIEMTINNDRIRTIVTKGQKSIVLVSSDTLSKTNKIRHDLIIILYHNIYQFQKPNNVAF